MGNETLRGQSRDLTQEGRAWADLGIDGKGAWHLGRQLIKTLHLIDTFPSFVLLATWQQTTQFIHIGICTCCPLQLASFRAPFMAVWPLRSSFPLLLPSLPVTQSRPGPPTADGLHRLTRVTSGGPLKVSGTLGPLVRPRNAGYGVQNRHLAATGLALCDPSSAPFRGLKVCARTEQQLEASFHLEEAHPTRILDTLFHLGNWNSKRKGLGIASQEPDSFVCVPAPCFPK